MTRWQTVGVRSYYIALAIGGALLLWALQPHFDLARNTLIAVAVVAVFLIFMERPTKAAGLAAAPLTAIVGASTVLFGWWALVLAALAWASIHWRVRNPARSLWGPAIAWAGQVGQSAVAISVMLPMWSFFQRYAATRTGFVTTIVTMVGIISVGIIYQTVNNALSAVSYAIARQRVASAVRFSMIGFIAAVYGYLLVAVYHFSGIIGAALFYIFVGQERMIQGVLGLTAQLQQVYAARTQARTLVSDLMRFADTEQGRYAEEVQKLAQRMAARLGLPREEVARIGLAAELHEIGKARLPARVRAGHNGNGNGNGQTENNAEPSLTPEEAAQLRMYPRTGALMVRHADALLPPEIADWIECHDEHFDGSGFPRGLKGEEIPLPSRVIAVAREFVRLTISASPADASKRGAALARLRDRSGTLYDPKLVQVLSDTVARYEY